MSEHEKEILAHCEGKYEVTEEVKSLANKYSACLLRCLELGSSNPLTREKSRDEFPSVLSPFLTYRKSEQESLSVLFNFAFSQLSKTVSAMSYKETWEQQAGAFTAAYFIVKESDFEPFEVEIR